MQKTTRAALAVSALAAGAVMAPAFTAGTADAATTTALCSFTYPNPNLFPVQANSSTSATQTVPGKVSISLKSNSMSILGYSQTFNITWANLDTGKSGSESVTKRVVGPDNTLTVSNVATGKGRIALVLGASNRSSIGPGSSNGDCTKELKVT